MPLPKPDPKDIQIQQTPPPPPPEVVGAVNALNVVKQIMDSTGQTTVTKDVLDTALQAIQEQQGS